MNKYSRFAAYCVAFYTPLSIAQDNNTPFVDPDKWQASLIVEAIYFDRSLSEELEIEGMPTGGHNHGYADGLQFGHSEITIGGPIGNWLSGRFTAAFAGTEDKGIEFEVEELYLETLGLGNGFSAKAGRFNSDIGYLSSKHSHEWDFVDQPLVYTSMFGEHVIGDGVQLNYLLPTDNYVLFGAELFGNDDFPSGHSSSLINTANLFAKTGGDIGTDHSWLLGVGHWRSANIADRSGEAHHHGDEEESEEGGETPRFSGDSYTNTINAVYKWAPNGNARETSFILQGEYFQRNENGRIDMIEEDGGFEETSSYDGNQNGWYLQGVYQFIPRWRVGYRYDHLSISNSGDDEEVLEEAELLSDGHTPQRHSVMLDYTPYEYMRLRFQYNRDERSTLTDDQYFIQFSYSFGQHGAHSF